MKGAGSTLVVVGLGAAVVEAAYFLTRSSPATTVQRQIDAAQAAQRAQRSGGKSKSGILGALDDILAAAGGVAGTVVAPGAGTAAGAKGGDTIGDFVRGLFS